MMEILVYLAESLLRIEKKVDEVLAGFSEKERRFSQPMDHTGQVCPLCRCPITYFPLAGGAVVGRSCNCKTTEVKT